MDDPVLKRARMLLDGLGLSNPTNEATDDIRGTKTSPKGLMKRNQSSRKVDESSHFSGKMVVQGITPSIDMAFALPSPRNADETTSTNLATFNESLSDDSMNAADSKLSFRCGVINGSSLVTTYDDIRGYCKQGSKIYINGTQYQLRGIGGEWISNCVELLSDYSGETDFNAVIEISQKGNAKATHRYENTGLKPVSSVDIYDSVKSLDSLNTDLRLKKKSLNGFEAERPKKWSKANQSHKDALLRHGIDTLQSQDETKDISDDIRIRDELKKTQDRIAEWKRKIELKLQEDALLHARDRSIKGSNSSSGMSHSNKVKSDKKRGKSLSIIKENDSHGLERDPIASDDAAIEPVTSEPEITIHEAIQKSNDELNKKKKKKIRKFCEKSEEERQLDEEKKAMDLAVEEENQKKILSLRERTLQRVQQFKSKLYEKEMMELEKKRKLEEEKKLRAESIPILRNRFLAVKQQTEERIQQLAKQEELRCQESMKQAERRLEILAQQRGRQRPTIDWFGSSSINHDESVSPSVRSRQNHSYSTNNIMKSSSKPIDAENNDIDPLNAFNRSKSEQSHRSQHTKSNQNHVNRKRSSMKSMPSKNGSILQSDDKTKEQSQESTQNEADDWSDDSLHPSKEEMADHSSRNRPDHYTIASLTRLSHGNIDKDISWSHPDESVLSDITEDFYDMKLSSNEYNDDKIRTKKKKKKGIPVWKLKPIEVRPYVPVPTAESER